MLLLVSKEPSYFPNQRMSGKFCESFIWEQTYLLFSFQQQGSHAEPCHSPSPFSCFLEGSGLPPSSHCNPGEPGALSSFQKSLRAFTALSPLFSSLLQQSGCTPKVGELQSCFEQICSESHCTTPADFNRRPTSFKRDYYQHSTTPVSTMLIFKICFFIKVLLLLCEHHSLPLTC